MKQETKTDLLQTLESYRASGVMRDQKQCLYSLVARSTGVEGSTVTVDDLRLLFDERLLPKGRGKEELLMNHDLKEAYDQAIQWSSQRLDFTVDLLNDLAAMVMKNAGNGSNGQNGFYGALTAELRKMGAGVDSRKVPAQLREFCLWVNEMREQLRHSDDVAEQYAFSFDAHCRLMAICPWMECSGLMARLVMNQLQFELGLEPSMILKGDGEEYLQASAEAVKQGDKEPFVEFMFKELLRQLGKETEGFKKSQD